MVAVRMNAVTKKRKLGVVCARWKGPHTELVHVCLWSFVACAAPERSSTGLPVGPAAPRLDVLRSTGDETDDSLFREARRWGWGGGFQV